MRALTFAAFGAAIGLVMAVVLGAGSIIIYSGAGSFTTSALHAMGFRIAAIGMPFVTAGIILGLVGSAIKSRGPEAAALNRFFMKGLGWHLFAPVAAFLFLYIISRESTTSMAFFLFALLGSVSTYIARSHEYRTRSTAPPPPAEIEGDPATLVWHPEWADRMPEPS